MREGEVLAAAKSSALPALEARGELAGLPYVAIEHVRGAGLDEIAADALPAEEARAVALDLARALAALHAEGWVHGDVAPSNVLIDDAGDAKLLDFGLARRVGEARAEVFGTPGYVAPEAALPGDVKAASDVYGWAVVVAECALGRRLFPEEELAAAANRSDAPRELQAWDEKIPGLCVALSRDPAARPTSEALTRGLEAMPRDREALAERVEARKRGEEPKALTPTAPMVQRVAPTIVEAESAIKSLEDKSPAERGARGAEKMVPLRWVLLAVAGIALFFVGHLSARILTRARPSAVSFAAGPPRRGTIEIDGEKTAPRPDGTMPVAPGQHTLVVTLPKGTRREYIFQVRPNEHVVLVAAKKSPAGKDDEEEEREP